MPPTGREFILLALPHCRRDHAAAQQRMRDARALKEGAADDYTALARQMHEMRAAKENAECDLGAAVLMYDQMRSDWSKKLKDRRKEVGGHLWGFWRLVEFLGNGVGVVFSACRRAGPGNGSWTCSNACG